MIQMWEEHKYEMYKWIDDRGAGKQFCTTAKGYMAWVPEEAQKDDLVCLLFGGATPFILRHAQDGTYRMLGACYVHVIMLGEGIGDEEWIRTNTRDFTIGLQCSNPS
jgi:hypothetical protein